MHVPGGDELEKLGRMALKAHAARVKAEKAKAVRLLFRCEEYERDDEHWPHYPRKHGSEDAPCWKRYCDDPPDNYYRLPEESWCQSCRDRQHAHETFLPLARSAGALKGALTKACKEITGT